MALSPWPTTPVAVQTAKTALAAAIGSSEEVAGRLGQSWRRWSNATLTALRKP